MTGFDLLARGAFHVKQETVPEPHRIPLAKSRGRRPRPKMLCPECGRSFPAHHRVRYELHWRIMHGGAR